MFSTPTVRKIYYIMGRVGIVKHSNYTYICIYICIICIYIYIREKQREIVIVGFVKNLIVNIKFYQKKSQIILRHFNNMTVFNCTLMGRRQMQKEKEKHQKCK